jgi:steroid 5-alpha reductase family enzyme
VLGFVGLSAVCLVFTLIVGAVAALTARRVGKVAVVDVFWGLFFVAVAWTSALFGSGGDWRRWVVAGLVTVWGTRLAWHIARRSRGQGEDPRYVELLAGAPGGDIWRYAVTRVFLVQAVLAWFISMPLQVVAVTSSGLAVVVVFALALWAVGFAFEAVGDAQLAAFKADPANRGQIMDRGLWGWTRHPNYFGDATMWWGLFAMAAASWPGALTVLSPAAMTWFLVVRTGAGLLEKTMAARPGYADYRARTSGFIPRLPRR